ncbi:hypothetical protein PC119_g11514 [Phytophthora cactorum]|nr:hypothetical protein PC111_g13525 [Phytophthora cactorum]KAG3016011.1 hypothetical protein PC119_g11514 [Phytophthora cactorum]KAG3176588.1 hypothetical protein C6341_g8873 [Phytophthora cactorum]
MCTLLSLPCLRRVRAGQLGAGLQLAGACTAGLGRGGSLAAAGGGLGVTAGSLLQLVLAGGGGLAAAVGRARATWWSSAPLRSRAAPAGVISSRVAECNNALQERRDNSREIEAVRLRHRNLHMQFNEAVEALQNRIAGLETRPMATTSAGSVGAVSPDASRHLLAKEARLAHARSNRNKALADRQQTEAKLRDLDSATTDLEKQVHRLLEAVAAKRRRIRELKTYFEQRLTRSSDVVTSQGEECGRLQELVDHLQENLQKASKQLKSVTCQRDHAAVEKIDPPSCSNHPYLVQMEASHALVKQHQ